MAQAKKSFEATFEVTMDERSTVYVGNLKPEITEEDIAHFLDVLGYKKFEVQMGIGCLATKRWNFCFVEFEDLIDANDLRHDLLEVSAQIGKCMPHRYSQCETQ